VHGVICVHHAQGMGDHGPCAHSAPQCHLRMFTKEMWHGQPALQADSFCYIKYRSLSFAPVPRAAMQQSCVCLEACALYVASPRRLGAHMRTPSTKSQDTHLVPCVQKTCLLILLSRAYPATIRRLMGLMKLHRVHTAATQDTRARMMAGAPRAWPHAPHVHA